MADEPGKSPTPTGGEILASCDYTAAGGSVAEPITGKHLTDLTDALAALSRSSEDEVKTTAPVAPASQEDRHEEAVQRWYLRYAVAGIVVGTLWLELIAVFWLLVWQGRGGHFKLNDWLIGVVAGGVIVQTVWCLQAIATHLFPEGAEKMKEVPKPKLGE